MFFKVQLIFNDASSDRLGRHTEKSSNLFGSKVVLKVLFQKFSRNIYTREFKKRGRVECETRREVTFPISDEKSMRAAFSTRLGNAT